MSEQNTTVIAFLSFIVGAVVGAIATLFLAPQSGAELRGRIGEEARADWDRAGIEWNRAMTEMRVQQHKALDEVNNQLVQLKAKVGPQASQDQANVTSPGEV